MVYHSYKINDDGTIGRKKSTKKITLVIEIFWLLSVASLMFFYNYALDSISVNPNSQGNIYVWKDPIPVLLVIHILLTVALIAMKIINYKRTEKKREELKKKLLEGEDISLGSSGNDTRPKSKPTLNLQKGHLV